jgi:hypothetical protein
MRGVGDGLHRQPVHAHQYQRQEQHQREQHARNAIAEQAGHAATRDEQCREEPRDDEEQRHPEQVQEPRDDIDRDRPPGVGERPDRMHQRAVCKRRMEDHAGEHRQRAQVVHVVETFAGLHRVALRGTRPCAHAASRQ